MQGNKDTATLETCLSYFLLQALRLRLLLLIPIATVDGGGQSSREEERDVEHSTAILQNPNKVINVIVRKTPNTVSTAKSKLIFSMSRLLV